MTRQTVRSAYGGVHPTEEEKERMLKNILERGHAILTDKKEYQGRPSKTGKLSVIAAVLATAAVLAVMVWFGKDYLLRDNPPEQATVPVDHQQTEMDLEENIWRYKDIFVKYFRAIEEGWKPEDCEYNGISIVCAGKESDQLGFAFLDLDGNGIQELILAKNDESQSILDLYTYSEGKVVNVFSGYDRIEYFLREGNLVYKVGSGGAAVTYYTFYRYQGTELVEEESILYNADKDPDNPWFMGTDLRPVTEAEAQAVISAHTIQRIPLMELSRAGIGASDEMIPTEETELPEPYRDTLEKYIRAIHDGWDKEMCEENGINPDCVSLDTSQIGYALQDLDGNGIQELIVAQDNNLQHLFDVFCLRGGQVSRVFSRSEKYQYFLMQGGTIYCTQQVSESVTGYSFWRIHEGQMYQSDLICYYSDTNPDNPWYDGFTLQPISDEEAYERLAARNPEHLDLILLSEMN